MTSDPRADPLRPAGGKRLAVLDACNRERQAPKLPDIVRDVGPPLSTAS